MAQPTKIQMIWPDQLRELTDVSSRRSCGAKADGAAVSRPVGIHAASRRWLSFGLGGLARNFFVMALFEFVST
jgi:hypothetical protein